MAERNADVPEDRRIDFRIGIHVGDIIIEDDDIFGDGVNIAARLEGTRRARRHLHLRRRLPSRSRDKLDASTSQDAGRAGAQEHRAAGARLPARRIEPGRRCHGHRLALLALPDKPSIAVLPFQNMSGDPEQDYFADGMVEDIITGLSRIKWLFVIARNSTFTYKGRAVDVKQVGRELGVRYVLEGSVRKAGDRVRITGQLIDAATGAHVWADATTASPTTSSRCRTRSRCPSSAPSSRACALPRSSASSASGRTVSMPTISCLQRPGRCLYRGCRSRRRRLLSLLERALALDPTYALAHAYAAECHHIDLPEGRDAGRAAARPPFAMPKRRIAYGQDDALALSFAGFVIGMDKHDRAAAFAAFDAALAHQSVFGCDPYLRAASYWRFPATPSAPSNGPNVHCG